MGSGVWNYEAYGLLFQKKTGLQKTL